MARDLVPAPQFGASSSKKRVQSGDLINATLRAGNEITIYADKVPADKAYHWGYGFTDRQASQTSFVYLDLRASGNGSGTADEEINGQLVLAVTDSTQEDVLAKRYFESLEDLRASQDDPRSERIMMPEHQPGAQEDRHLELRVVADASSDGYEVDSDAGSAAAQINYGVVSL
jgi:hypothetical protein